MPKIVGVLPPAHAFRAFCPLVGSVVRLLDTAPCPHCGVNNAHLDQHPNWMGGLMVPALGGPPDQVARRRAMKGYSK